MTTINKKTKKKRDSNFLEPQRSVQKPNGTSTFNSQAEFSKHKAILKKISNTIGDGDCLYDTILQGMRVNEDKKQFSSFRQLRQESSKWASEHAHCAVGKDLTIIQLLSNHLQLGNEELSLVAYEAW